MFTEEEMHKYLEYIETVTIEDLPTPEIPILNLPSALIHEIKEVVYKRIRFLESQKNAPIRVEFDVYRLHLDYFLKVVPAFTAPSMVVVWEDLYNKNNSAAVRFASELFLIENKYDGFLRLLEKHKNEIASCEKMINSAIKLYKSMDEYQCHYYGHMLQPNHERMMRMLKVFVINSEDDLEAFKEHCKDPARFGSSYWPVTRKYQGDNALAIFFMRSIYISFMEKYKKPMHGHIAKIIDVIFELPFNENQIIKHCAQIKSYLREDSKG